MTSPGADDDDLLLARWLKGERGTLDILVERHGEALFRLAYRLSGSREDAEDLVQETFARMLAAAQRYRPSGRFAAWLRTILVRLALDRSRHARPHSPYAETIDYSPGPEEAVMQRDSARRVRAAIGRLPPGYRAIVVLLNGEGLSVREVAETLGLPESLVKNRAFRARKMLRDALGDPREEVGADGRRATQERATERGPAAGRSR